MSMKIKTIAQGKVSKTRPVFIPGLGRVLISEHASGKVPGGSVGIRTYVDTYRVDEAIYWVASMYIR